jgi:hypothetical protein
MLHKEKFRSIKGMQYLHTIQETFRQNSIEILKSRLKSGNASYHSVQKLLSSNFPSKNLKIKISRTIIWLVWISVSGGSIDFYLELLITSMKTNFCM